MTNEQKAVKIATYDKWVKRRSYYSRDGAKGYSDVILTQIYLTDLNYLVPVAVKVRDEIERCKNEFNKTLDEFDECFGLFENLYFAHRDIIKTPEGTYQPLFDAVYEAIIYLENQKP